MLSTWHRTSSICDRASHNLSAGRPCERRDPSPLASKVKKGFCSTAETTVRAVWVPAFAGTTRRAGRLQSDLPHHPHIHLALDIRPFLGGAQFTDEFLEHGFVLGRVFEPGQEIEGLAEVAAMIKLPRDRRQVFQGAGDVARLVLENAPPLFLRQFPPGR